MSVNQPVVRTREVDSAVVVGVDLVDHVLQFGLGRVLTQGAHDSAELLGGDLTCETPMLVRAGNRRYTARSDHP